MLPTYKDPTLAQLNTLQDYGYIQLCTIYETRNKWLFIDLDTKWIYDLGASDINKVVLIPLGEKYKLESIRKGTLEVSVSWL